jgi:hypothetical protein
MISLTLILALLIGAFALGLKFAIDLIRNRRRKTAVFRSSISKT